MNKATTVVAPENLPKVRDFMEARARVDAFKALHSEVFKAFEEVLEDYNTKLEDAEKEVRSRGVNCGPFKVCGEQTSVDADRLYEELGEEDFLKLGGSIETKRVLSVDRQKFSAYVDSGTVPEEVVKATFRRTNKYKAPIKAELP